MSDDRSQNPTGDSGSGRERIEVRSTGGDAGPEGDAGSGVGGAGDATRGWEGGSGGTGEEPGEEYDRSYGDDRTRQSEAVAAPAPEPTVVTESPDRASIVARQKEAFGGVKPFVAFFGWLTATGMSVLLTALLTAAGATVGEINASDASSAVDSSGLSADAITWIGVVIVLVVVFIAYYAGGYVAGRMARFDGMRQGVAVWLWAVVISVVVAVLGYFFGSEDNMLGSVSNLQLPSAGLSTQALVALVGIIVVSLVAAVLGGLAGMHFHRKVDVAGLGR